MTSSNMTVCVLGLGYIGLPTAAMLALGGHEVSGYDIDRNLIDALAAGASNVKEESVRALVQRALASGNLRLCSELPKARAYIICVPTPTVAHRPDLSFVTDAVRAIARKLEPGDLVVLESTVPPGTTERVIAATIRAASRNPDDYAIVHCPERVIPGKIVAELTENDRIIGGRRPGDAAKARDLYASFCRGNIHLTDTTTAELVKVVENTFRDVNIAFANELALLAEELGVDAHEVISLANNHPRVSILKPGPGVGGHCIPVDPHFLSNANPFVTELIQTARRINERMPHVIVKRVAEFVPPRAEGGGIVTLLGASYKANIDDTRESPTTRILELLEEYGYTVRVHDPVAGKYLRPLVPTLEAAVKHADAVVLVTPHDAFATIDPAAIGPLMRGRNLIDAHAFFPEKRWRKAGFNVYAVGGRRTSPEGERDSALSA